MADGYGDTAEVAEEAKPRRSKADPATVLQAIMAATNLVPEIKDEDRIANLGEMVCREYELDWESTKDWRDANRESMDLAMMIAEDKTYPFEGASNVKWPLLTVGALQFNARAYPAICHPERPVKCKTRGRDPNGTKAARADRVSEHMSNDLLNEMEEWEEDTDRLLVQLPIEGSRFRKVYYDPALGRKVTRNLGADRVVVNMGARSLRDVPRITERLYLYPHEVEERIRDGRYVEFDYKNTEKDPNRDDANDASDDDDPDGPMLFLEQHRLYDLDQDGYPEPYICTVHKGSSTVVRIVANFDPKSIRFGEKGKVASIRRRDYYVKYEFLPNPEGGFYGVGLGWLLKDTNESINTSLNQMFDAGHLANMQGGFISSIAGIREKHISITRGEFRVINTTMPLNQAIMPIQFDGPSPVLFQLLGLLIESGEKVASIKDVLTGETQATAPVGTTLALIEQGLQVFTSIYKRIHRALRQELGLMAALNVENLSAEEYSAFFDEQQDPKADYDLSDMDILPVSDPQAVTKMQKIAKAQAIYELSKENQFMNGGEATARVLEAIEAEDVEKLVKQPDPAEEAFMKVMQRLEVEGRVNEVMESFTKALKNVADAEAAEEGQQLSFMDFYLKTLQAEMSGEQQENAQLAQQGGIPGMAGPPNDAMGVQPPPGPGPGMGGEPTGPAVQQPGGPVPNGMGGPPAAGGVPQGAL